MPDEAKEATIETAPKEAAPSLNEDKLAIAISKGIGEQLKDVLAERSRPDRAAGPPPPAALPPDVSDEDIDAAIDAGDKVRANDLRRKQRLAAQARLNREVDERYAPALAAINQLSEASVASDPAFKRYEKEVRGLIAQVPQGTALTAEHWRSALNMVKGQHADELAEERYEERVRQQREQSAAPAPTRAATSAPEEPEMNTLTEAFGASFKESFKKKAQAVGGRSEDEEVRTFDKWFREKMPRDFSKLDEKGQPTKFTKVETVKSFINEALEMQKLAEEDPSLGLGS